MKAKKRKVFVAGTDEFGAFLVTKFVTVKSKKK